MRNQSFGGRLRGDILPATTWANRPAASSVPAGTLLPVTGFGATPVMFESDGTAYWYPQGGYQGLYHLQGTVSTPIATLTGDGTDKPFVLPKDLLLPAGMLFPGLCLEIGALVSCLTKSTGHTGQFAVAFGTTNASTSPNVWLTSSPATVPSVVRGMSNSFVQSGVIVRNTGGALTGSPASASWGLPSDIADADILTADRYAVPLLRSNYVDGEVALLAISIALRA